MENKEQKYKNLTLITLNNTLHIKADNLEPVEVDSSCIDELKELAIERYKKWQTLNGIKEPYEPILPLRLSISQLSDRIEVREVETKCGHCNKLYRCTNCDESCGREGHFIYTEKAFLLSEKEWVDTKDFTWKDSTKEEIISEALPSLTSKYSLEKSYTIEEIEKAMDGIVFGYARIELINNLKK